MEMMGLKVPVLSVLIGEGGSGGALALAVADEVWMLENAIYSVIAPESCANILWRDTDKAAEAAENLKLTAKDAYQLGVVERIISERGGDTALMYVSLALSIRKLVLKTKAFSARASFQGAVRKDFETGVPHRNNSAEMPGGMLRCSRSHPNSTCDLHRLLALY